MLQVSFSFDLKGPRSKYVRMTDGSKQQNYNDSNSKSSFQAGEKYPGSMMFSPEIQDSFVASWEYVLSREVGGW